MVTHPKMKLQHVGGDLLKMGKKRLGRSYWIHFLVKYSVINI